VFSITLEEEKGGVGLGVADAVVVFEELGRALTPGPLVGTALAAGLVKGAAEGSTAVGVLTESSPAVPVLVEHLGSIESLMVVGQGRAIKLLDPAKLSSTRVEDPLDPLTPMWRVDPPLPPGELVGDRLTGSRIVRDGTLMTAAQQIGHAGAVLERAVAYAKERVQFGRPIGSFQAIKHMCADMLVRVEVARCAVHAAACLADQPAALAQEAEATGRPAEEVLQHAMWGAKLLADEAAVANCRGAIQVHGGMGFTWEEPLHLYLKRSLVAASTFGRAAHLSQALGSQL
jgi:alkylation response protein AidB-like acyl-CoA dehydrogenase